MTTEGIPLGDISVTIGMPVDNPIPHKTVASLCATVHQLTLMGVRHSIAMHVCGVVELGRNHVLADFLRGDADKLFWIDSDMVWEPADFLRLLALSTKVDVVGASYPAKVDGPTTFYVNHGGDLQMNAYGLMQAKGLGLGFTVVSRKICEELAAKARKAKDQISGAELPIVFRVDVTDDGLVRTEDMAFFADIREAGYPVWVDPTISLGHVGEREWRGRLADALHPKSAAA